MDIIFRNRQNHGVDLALFTVTSCMAGHSIFFIRSVMVVTSM
jgi:hypothetical protein